MSESEVSERVKLAVALGVALADSLLRLQADSELLPNIGYGRPVKITVINRKLSQNLQSDPQNGGPVA